MKTQSPILKAQYLFTLTVIFSLAVILLSGCATVATRENLPAYNIHGITYLPLITLCELKGIDLEYDKFARTATLTKDTHKINLMAGDTLVLVDGLAQHLDHPVEIYQGTIAVPYKFKERVLDNLFKESYPQRRAAIPLVKIKKIVIDAGHGGNDPGAIGRTGLREKDVNLDIAKRLNKLLRSEGVEVVMTRAIDKFVPLSTRTEIANNSAADLFVSIHSNANRVRSLSGFEVYYVANSMNDDSKRAYSAAKNAVLKLDSSCFTGHSLALKAILWDMLYTYSRAESIVLARALCQAIDSNLDSKILGIKGARFEVLRGVRMPAVLIETGFLSNYNEERLLKNSYFRQKISEAILQGIKSYAQGIALTEVAVR